MARSGMSRFNVCAFLVLSVALLLGLAQASFVMSSDSFVPHRRSGINGDMDSEVSRRMLAAASGGYYISYGSLTANRVPCPPQSGRSYYTPNCASASGPVRPYTRGCSTISRCARDSG